MHVDFHDRDDQTRARTTTRSDHVTITFYDRNGEVAIYLPLKMAACAAMIVGAFNAHMSGETPKEAAANILGSTLNLDDHAMQAVERRDLP